jgi:hypothetical protein
LVGARLGRIPRREAWMLVSPLKIKFEIDAMGVAAR